MQRHGRGGKRKGAGRKRGPRVSHARRGRVGRGRPVHATLRVRGDLPSLRRRVLFAIVELALAAVLTRAGFRVVHFSVQSNHIHLFIEAADAKALGRGMQALSIRIARRINRELGRRGAVLSDRYHARVLRTPREVRNALCYILQNHRRHVQRDLDASGAMLDPEWIDPCSSGRAFDGWRGRPPSSGDPPPPVAPATFWLVTVGWRRCGLIATDEVPRAAVS